MTTTASVDPKTNILTVITDQAFGAGAVVVGADSTPFTFARNPITVSGATAKPIANDQGTPKTTATFQLS
jgi:hypothetical protein